MGDTFSDLPDALMRDLLAQATAVAKRVSTHLNRLRQARGTIRQRVRLAGLIARKFVAALSYIGQKRVEAARLAEPNRPEPCREIGAKNGVLK